MILTLRRSGGHRRMKSAPRRTSPYPSPVVWDTDGDGIGDGTEIADGLDPLSLDSDGDGYDDDEELLAGLDPLSGDSGAQRSIRYYHDDDDRLMSVFLDCHHAVKFVHRSDLNAVRHDER